MVQLKKYLPLQVILLFTLHLLSADKKLTTKNDIQNDAVIPHIASGPGKILDISKKSVVRNDESKDINDLLYQVYKKFHTDTKRHASGIEKIQQKKNLIVETDAITNPQKKDVLSKAKVVKKTVKFNDMKPVRQENVANKAVKKEEHKIALRELEKTIDKLIASLTRVSKDGKFQENEINKGIQDMSKFADLSHIYTPAKDNGYVAEKNNDEIESFGDFKERFYKTFLGADKRQNIVYHGKKDSVTPRIVYHGRDGNSAKQYRDSSNNIKQHDQQRRAQHDLQNDPQHREVIAKKNANNISGERMKELADLYEELKIQTAEETKRTNVKKAFQRTKRRDKEREKNVKIERVKDDLVSLFDLISNNEGVSSGAGSRKDSLHHGDNAGYTAGKKINAGYQSRDDIDSNLSANKITKNGFVTEDQNQIKRRLLSMVRSLEAQLSKQDSGVLPARNIQSEKDVSHKISDRFESELDSIASGTIQSNKKKARNEFVDAMKGFVIQSKDSEKKSTQ